MTITVNEFLRPRLTGARFSDRSIPLEFLKDLSVLEEMIIEVAKAEYLNDHSDRKRSPRGFTEGIELKLTGIDEGSAIPVISLEVTGPTLFPPQNQVYFERARDSVVEAIGAAEENGQITDYLPEKSLGYFDRFGRSLREGEAIEFTTPQRTHPVRLTKESRRRLLLASSSVKELTEETSIRATVPELDQDRMSCQLQLVDGHKVSASLSEQHLETILEAFNGYKSGVHVLVQGVARFNRSNRLLAFDLIEHVSILDILDIDVRLEQLNALEDGWLEGDGIAPSSEGLQWFAGAFDKFYPDELLLPFLYPTAEGGLQAEWSLGHHEVTLEMDLQTHTGEWHSIDSQTDNDDSRTLQLDEQEDWAWLVEQVRGMSGDMSQ